MMESDLVCVETKECEIVWHRPWSDTIYVRNPFSVVVFPVPKPKWFDSHIKDKQSASGQIENKPLTDLPQ